MWSCWLVFLWSCSVRRRPIQRNCFRRNCGQPGGQMGASKRSCPTVSCDLLTSDRSWEPGQNSEWAVIIAFGWFAQITVFSERHHRSSLSVSRALNLNCQQVLVPGGDKRVVLQSLQPDTRYSVFVTAEYHSREGGSGSAQGKTGKWNNTPEQEMCFWHRI